MRASHPSKACANLSPPPPPHQNLPSSRPFPHVVQKLSSILSLHSRFQGGASRPRQQPLAVNGGRGANGDLHRGREEPCRQPHRLPPSDRPLDHSTIRPYPLSPLPAKIVGVCFQRVLCLRERSKRRPLPPSSPAPAHPQCLRSSPAPAAPKVKTPWSLQTIRYSPRPSGVNGL